MANQRMVVSRCRQSGGELGTRASQNRLPVLHISHLPCTDPDSFCPTCAVFGSVSTVRTVDNEQAGYATHIHVGWGTSREPAQPDTFTEVSPTNVWIAPLRNPKPSSGGFYLEAQANRAASTPADQKLTYSAGALASIENDPPNAPRKIRGRKSTGTDKLPIRIGHRDRRRGVIISAMSMARYQPAKGTRSLPAPSSPQESPSRTSILNSSRGS